MTKDADQVFDIKAANLSLKSAMASAIDTGKKIDLKNLNLGADGNALAIDEELGRTIMERARENVAILGLIASKSVGSVEYREMVLVNFPTTAAVGEQTSGTNPAINWDQTDTQKYVSMSLMVAKQYAKPQISREAINDPHIDIFAHLQSLLAEELSRYWARQVLFGAGDGSNNMLRGILGPLRFTGSTGDSALPTFHASTPRPVNTYPSLPSGITDSIGHTDPTDPDSAIDNVIDLTAKLPSRYLSGSVYTMNRFTLAQYRKLKDLEGRPLIQFEAGSFMLAGYPVVLEDYMPLADGTTEAGVNVKAPVIFGKLAEAYALCSIDEHFLVDPYSVDGAIVLKTEIRKGDIVQKNDAIVILATD